MVFSIHYIEWWVFWSESWARSHYSSFYPTPATNFTFHILYFFLAHEPHEHKQQELCCCSTPVQSKKVYLFNGNIVHFTFIKSWNSWNNIAKKLSRKSSTRAASDTIISWLFPKTHSRHIKTLQKKLRNKIYRISSSKVIIWKSDTA